MAKKLKDFVNKVKTFFKNNWQGAVTFLTILAAIAVIIIICELYQYMALNVWPGVS